MNIFAWFATLVLYFVLCTFVPIGSGIIGILLAVWRRTRVLGLGILFAGGVVGFLIALPMVINSETHNLKFEVSDLVFAGLGGWAGFGIGATVAIALGTPIFLVTILAIKIFKHDEAATHIKSTL